MNDELKAHARLKLKEGLAQCNEGQQGLFKRMYSGPHRRRTPEDLATIAASSIDDVVDGMDDDNLSRAMEQVEATLAKGK